MKCEKDFKNIMYGENLPVILFTRKVKKSMKRKYQNAFLLSSPTVDDTKCNLTV